MDLARAPRRRPLTARKKGSGYENESMPVRGLGSVMPLPNPRTGILWEREYEIAFEFDVYMSCKVKENFTSKVKTRN